VGASWGLGARKPCSACAAFFSALTTQGAPSADHSAEDVGHGGLVEEASDLFGGALPPVVYRAGMGVTALRTTQQATAAAPSKGVEERDDP
jgi:hypothetical protein